ncbi:MAG: KilA-N domain-containing protein [Deltaproteobacteria bacterium]|nr:KilA-N domain-containing protein [Deltaproteobacteria bacterium]
MGILSDTGNKPPFPAEKRILLTAESSATNLTDPDQTLSRSEVFSRNSLIKIKWRDRYQGTWLHRKLVLDFPRWLSSDCAAALFGVLNSAQYCSPTASWSTPQTKHLFLKISDFCNQKGFKNKRYFSS